jgi:hypothetical protein
LIESTDNAINPVRASLLSVLGTVSAPKTAAHPAGIGRSSYNSGEEQHSLKKRSFCDGLEVLSTLIPLIFCLVVSGGPAIAATDEDDNNFFGTEAGISDTGSYNSFFCCAAGDSNMTGSYNCFCGYHAGCNNTVGDRNTFIGYTADINPGADPATNPVANATAIGIRAYVSQPSSLVLGSIKAEASSAAISFM